MEEDILTPPDLVFGTQVFELAFHPFNDIVATGLINGHVEVYQYSPEGNHQVLHLTHHRKSCRALTFSPDGSILYTGSGDKSLQAIDLNTGNVIAAIEKAHAHKINTILSFDTYFLSTGDDNGCIKIWDTRQAKSVCEFHENKDFISDFTYRDGKKCLLAASGDGTLSVFNMRKRALYAKSDDQDDEYLSVVSMKNGKKVVCGTQDGILDIYTWDQFADISDRFPGHPESIDSLVKLTDDILATASSDGLIRVVNIQPNKLLGVLGEHENFPVERIRKSRDNKYIGSCSHDHRVKFWNIEDFLEGGNGEVEGEGEEEMTGEEVAEGGEGSMVDNNNDDDQYEDEDDNDNDQYEDDDDDDDSDDDDDDDDDDNGSAMQVDNSRGKLSKKKAKMGKKKNKKKGNVDPHFFDGLQ